MKKRLAAVWLLVSLVLCLTGCFADYDTAPVTDSAEQMAETIVSEEAQTALTDEETEPAAGTIAQSEPPAQTYAEPEDEPLPPSMDKDGSYTSPEDVAEYIHTFGTLPDNFITKKEAQALGWVSSEGNLWDVAPGKSIGGDYFGNREGLLPEGSYHECDVNYAGGFRGSERLIYGEDGSIWYTGDHYASFEQLY